MKLELKHLAPYLPYGLKIEHPTMLVGKREISELKNLGQTNIEISHRLYVQISDCKPILRPLSDLGKEISNQKTFLHKIAIDLGLLKDDNFIFEFKFSDYGDYGNKDSFSIITPRNYNLIQIPKKELPKSLSYQIFNQLVSEHFDVFGLIDKGLAISIHDVEQVIA